MANVFSLNQFELLAKTYAWFYQTYRARGFSYDYFPIELKAWTDAIQSRLALEHQKPILEIYTWLLAMHDKLVILAQHQSDESDGYGALDASLRKRFLDALLNAEHTEARLIAREVKDAAGFESFLLEVIQPSMYEIGRLWEQNIVSVAQEHLASSIVSRVMSQLYADIVSIKPTKGRAVITAAPNEYHELGAWMVSDLLELDGWQIRYLGTSTPLPDLLKLLEDFKPHLLAISVTMPFNLDKVKNIITAVRERESLRTIKIMVGGGVLQTMPNLWSELGADAVAGNAKEAVEVAGKLCS
jgi:methanogenic corrinoid protein MtbC1